MSAAAIHLKHLHDVQTLVGALKWIREKKDMYQPVKSFFYQFPFHQHLVKAMLDKYPQDDPNLVEYLHMITPSVYSESAKILLEKVDDPLVTSTCVKTLLARKDDGLLVVA